LGISVLDETDKGKNCTFTVKPYDTFYKNVFTTLRNDSHPDSPEEC
jgi:hypothetical protein